MTSDIPENRAAVPVPPGGSQQAEKEWHAACDETPGLQGAALEAAANAIVITDLLGTIQSVNPAFTALTGYSAQEAVGQNPRILKSGRQDEAFYRQLWETISSGKVWRGELVNRRKDGSLYTEEMSIAPMRGPDGRTTRYIATKQDVTRRKQAEELLQFSEERFRNLVENTSDWVWEIDERGAYTYASPRVKDLLGYAPEEVLGKSPFDLMPPEEAARVGALLAPSLAAHGPFRGVENTNRHKEGHTVVVETSGVPIFDAAGEWRGYRGIDRDITERKRVEEALRYTEERFRELAENITDVFWVTDARMSKILYVSPAFERLWGRSCQSAYDRPDSFIDGIHPDDRQGVLGELEQMMANGMFEWQYRVVHPDGSTRWVLDRSFPVRDEKGEIVRIAGIAQDITGRKAAEDSLRRSEERFRALIETARDVIFTLSSQGIMTSLNSAYYAMSGWTEKECVGQSYEKLIYADDLPRARTLFARFLQGETLPAFELRLNRKEGPPVPAELTVAAHHEDGRLVELLGIARDISERKQAEAALEKSHQALLDVSRQAGMAEVATGVLHNVGNVLNSVNVSATLVAEHIRHTQAVNVGAVAALVAEHRADLPAFFTHDERGQMLPDYLATLAEALTEEREMLLGELDDLRKNIEHIKEIVMMQQAYARTSGVIEPVPVVDLIEDSLRINAGALIRHDVEIVRDYQDQPVVRTDKNKVIQILINLVRNAKYACAESGRVDRHLTLRVSSDARHVYVAVADNGVGIASENLTKIFERGFTTRDSGHGFGLHSSVLTAKELGGSLVAQSDGIGRGATFILELPRAPTEDSP